MKTMLWITGMLILTMTLGAQEVSDQTRRELLVQAQKELLEEYPFAPEDLIKLENARRQAEINNETELAGDLGIILFAARQSSASQIFTRDSQFVLSQAWEKETRRRELELTKGLMNGSAGTLAVLAAGSLGAGIIFFQMSSGAFADYADSPVNSPASQTFRKNYQTYETASYGLMISSAILFTLSSRLMFLQN